MVEPNLQQSASGEFAFMRSAEIFVANAYTVLALPASATLGSHKPRIVELRWVEQVTVKMIFHNDTFKQLNNSSLTRLATVAILFHALAARYLLFARRID